MAVEESVQTAAPEAALRSRTAAAPCFSAVVPVFNEEGNLPELHARLTEVFRGLGRTYEIVFVDDGSTDRSMAVLEDLNRRDPRVRVIQFSRNFGHHIAVTAGMDACRGDFVILMDADLQDRPEEIPSLFRKIEEGYDVVYGIRTGRRHSLPKRLASALFVATMRHMVSGFDLNSGIFRMARRNVIDTVRQCRETHRFVVGLMSWSGFRQVGVDVQHGARHAGVTKYTLRKQVRLAVNAMVAFTHVPLRLATYLGLIVSVSAFAYAAVIVVRKLFLGLGVEGWPSLMVAVLFLGGIQLVCLGILGEYVGRLFTEAQHRPLYVVARRLEPEEPDESA